MKARKALLPKGLTAARERREHRKNKLAGVCASGTNNGSFADGGQLFLMALYTRGVDTGRTNYTAAEGDFSARTAAEAVHSFYNAQSIIIVQCKYLFATQTDWTGKKIRKNAVHLNCML